MKTVYRIRRKSDGKFSAGGWSPTFTAKGKVWRNMGGLTNHLNCAEKNRQYPYADCEIVTIEVREVETGVLSIADWQEERAAKEREKAAKVLERIEKSKCPACHGSGKKGHAH